MNQHRLTMAASGAVVLSLASSAPADPERGSLFLREPPPAVRNTPDATPRLAYASLFAVVPPPPREFQQHDIVQIVINETSLQEFEQTLETEKSYDLNGQVGPLPSLRHLLELQLEGGDSDILANWAARNDRSYEGEGTFERRDRFTTRVSAEVIEIKPNGNMLIEAKKIYESDSESVTLVISGLVRQEDVTEQNTIQSTQMANLVLRVRNEGEVKKAAEKGVISKVLDTVFAF